MCLYVRVFFLAFIRVCGYMYVKLCVYMHLCICMRVRVRVFSARACKCMCACMHVYIRNSFVLSVDDWVGGFIDAQVHEWVGACACLSGMCMSITAHSTSTHVETKIDV